MFLYYYTHSAYVGYTSYAIDFVLFLVYYLHWCDSYVICDLIYWFFWLVCKIGFLWHSHGVFEQIIVQFCSRKQPFYFYSSGDFILDGFTYCQPLVVFKIPFVGVFMRFTYTYSTGIYFDGFFPCLWFRYWLIYLL